MNQTVKIKIDKRVDMNSRASRKLRKSGYLPGIIMSKGTESIPVTVKKEELKNKLAKYGRNAVFKLVMSKDKTYTVLVKEIQNSYRGDLLHVDFQQISFSEEIKADVAIKLIGKELLESKRFLLMQQIDSIAVKGLPQNIPDVIEIDVSDLHDGDIIDIGSISLPEGITTDIPPEQIVVSVSESRRAQRVESEDEVKAQDDAGDSEEAQA